MPGVFFTCSIKSMGIEENFELSKAGKKLKFKKLIWKCIARYNTFCGEYWKDEEEFKTFLSFMLFYHKINQRFLQKMAIHFGVI